MLGNDRTNCANVSAACSWASRTFGRFSRRPWMSSVGGQAELASGMLLAQTPALLSSRMTRNQHRRTALHHAAFKNRPQMVQVLLDLGAVPVGDGHSNVTFGLSTDVILRRPPRGPLPPSAHDVLREARLLRALEPTSVRTPRALAV